MNHLTRELVAVITAVVGLVIALLSMTTGVVIAPEEQAGVVGGILTVAGVAARVWFALRGLPDMEE